MISMRSLFTPLVVLLVVINPELVIAQRELLVDSQATKETKNLHQNLKKISQTQILFGHQHATEYGHGWSGEENRSDVKSITGSHPAVIGVDIFSITTGSKQTIAIEKERLRKNVVDTYNRGGVTTISWHFSNPVSNGGFYWNDSISLPAVKYIIPGGEAHEKYKSILDEIASWAHSLKGSDGKLVPLIFRPYHEFDGGWFWWGKPHCTKEEFISLWRFTVTYLRDNQHVHNFIYAFSPDNRFKNEAEYLERYPGDEWVDILGIDNYGDMGRYHYALDSAAFKLKVISDYAQKAGKLCAFTETGLESIPNPTWWTEALLRVLKTHRMPLAYVLVWRNDPRSPTHYYAPYPGQVSVDDFIKFYNDDYTLFENDLKNIYGKAK